MISKKGAKEETKTTISMARRGPTKSFNLRRFFFCAGEGWAGVWGMAHGGAAGAPPATPGARHHQLASENRGV